MTFELKQIFAHSPAEFEFSSGMSWEPPCGISVNLYLKPVSEASKNEFLFPLVMPNWIDAFAKVSHEKQFETAFWRFLDFASGPNHDSWFWELNNWHGKLKEQLRNPDAMFQQPFRFVRREQFVEVDLATILREDPERTNIYLIEEERTYTSYLFLRIHSSLWHFFPNSQHFWFEKRVPCELEVESILPWFKETVRRIPKKPQPPDADVWIERLLRSEPKLLPQPENGTNKAWQDKPKVILVFGATKKVGYRSSFTLERSKISRLVRSQELLTIVSEVQYGFRANQSHEWTFYLLTADELAAQKVEREITNGTKVHFGLDLNIVGMVAQTCGVIHSINVPLEKICELCLKDGESLSANESNSRYKHKIYCVATKSVSQPAQ